MTTPDPNAPPVNTPPVPPVNTPPWYGTPDAETLGYLQTRGLDKLTPDKAALEAVKAHREAEKLLGVPQDQIIRIPPTNDTEGWKKVHQRLGAPEAADKYDLSSVKNPDGSALDENQTKVLRDLAFSLNLDPARAVSLVNELAKISKTEIDGATAKSAGERAVQVNELKNNWTHNATVFTVVAENAAKALGLDPALLKTEGADVKIPYAKAMELFRNIGNRLGEDKFVQADGQGNKPITVEQAQYKLNQLSNDKAWYTKFQAGDQVAAQEFYNLTRIVAGQ